MSTTKICIQCGAEYDVGQKFCPNDGSPLRLQSPDDALIGQLVADRYQMLSLIGEGGMGRVYLAEHIRMGRKSAVKVINPALATTSDAIARFNREAANACRINHPNVAQVYDFGEMADGTLYLAMEYVEGETLDAVIAREGSLPPRRAALVTKQVADALFAAHHLGIVHRDLKPENVMLARHLDGSDWVKVVDFGIAKTVQRDGAGSQTVTTAGVSLGTPEYMSPEQLAGEKLDHRTDIYSLGLVLFNMLTGELPYPKVTSKETLVRRLTSKPRTLTEVRAVAWPPGLQEALDRALATEVADRYDSVAEFGRDVVRAAEETATVPVAAVGTESSAPTSRRLPQTGHAVERPMAHRRALPWIVATAVLLVSVALFATTRSHRGATPSPATAVVVLDSSNDTFSAPAGTLITPTLPTPPSIGRQRVEGPPPSIAAPTAPRPAAGSRSDSGLFGGQRANMAMADSITRATAGISASKMVNLDSIFASIGPEIERARRAQLEGARGTVIGRHYWLLPSGDSVGGRPNPRRATPSMRVAAAADEIRAHITRMKQRFASDDLGAARIELNAASTELGMLHELAPASPITTSLEAELGQGVRDLIVACYRKQADSTFVRNVRCDDLFAGRAVRAGNPRRVPR